MVTLGFFDNTLGQLLLKRPLELGPGKAGSLYSPMRDELMFHCRRRSSHRSGRQRRRPERGACRRGLDGSRSHRYLPFEER